MSAKRNPPKTQSPVEGLGENDKSEKHSFVGCVDTKNIHQYLFPFNLVQLGKTGEANLE
jgi:hypothetical protein